MIEFGLFEIATVASMVLLAGSSGAADDQAEPADDDKDTPAGGLGDPVDVEFTASLDGSVQRYVKMLPEGFDAEKRHDVLIGLHGRGSDRWQYAKNERGECSGARDVAARFNMIYISPDYRGTDAGMNTQAEADLLQIISMLREEYRIGKVFLTGGSMGGISVLIFAARHPGLVHGAVSANGKADWLFRDPDDPAATTGDEQQKADRVDSRAPEFTPEEFTMPVAFTVGGDDPVVPPDSVRRLYAKLQQLGKRDVLLIDRPNAGHATNYADTVASLEFVIRAAAESE